MCDPITIAGIALTAGSTVANTIGANRAAKARDQALAAERIRQGGLDQEAMALNTEAQDQYQDFGAKQDETSSKLGEYFTEQKIENATGNAAAAGQMLVPQSGSAAVVREEGKQRAGADAFSDQQGAALGELRAFGDLIGSTGRENANTFGQIGQIGGFKRGSSNIVPLELDQASRAGDGARMIGDVLNLGGSFALSKGLGGAAKAADPWSGMRSVGSTSRGSGGLYKLFG